MPSAFSEQRACPLIPGLARDPATAHSAAACAKWAVEDCFAEAKNETSLDHYWDREYRAWYRHIALSMLAHAVTA